MDPMRVKLEKIGSNHNRLKHTVYEGATTTLPYAGQSFWMGTPNPDCAKEAKLLRTSRVKSVVAKALYQVTGREAVTMRPRLGGAGWVQILGEPPQVVAELTDLEMVKENFSPTYEFETENSHYRLTVLGRSTDFDRGA